MTNLPGLNRRTSSQDTPQVNEAERNIAGVLGDLEVDSDSEVKCLGLDDVVDTDAQGRPEVKKSVDIQVEHKPKRGWAR